MVITPESEKPAEPSPDQRKWTSELTFLATALRWLGGAATVGSLLGGVGWYIEISQNGLLGIRTQLSSDFVTTYLILFAQFVIDCIRVVLSWHPRTVAATCVLVAVVVLVQTRWRNKAESWIASHTIVGAGIVLVIVVAWISYFWFLDAQSSGKRSRARAQPTMMRLQPAATVLAGGMQRRCPIAPRP
jgi:hypothetical protein